MATGVTWRLISSEPACIGGIPRHTEGIHSLTEIEAATMVRCRRMRGGGTLLRAALAEALAGRRLSRRAARQLAATLRQITGALPPGAGNLAGLSRHLNAAADILDAQIASPRST